MTAQIIQFPGLIERVVHRLLRVMEAPPGRLRDAAYVDATIDIDASEVALSDEQRALVWRRVDELMS